MRPLVSVIIPAYNRAGLLRYTLESLRRGLGDLAAEILVVDDGSDPPLASQIEDFQDLPLRWLSQTNQGSIVARLHGLSQAQGRYILFLDSDDLVHPEKLPRQVGALETSGADVCYTDTAWVTLGGPYESLAIQPRGDLPLVSRPADLYLDVQPPPHSCLYRSTYLRPYLEQPLVPVDRRFDPVGDVWIYYNLAPYPARITKITGHYTLYSQHGEGRYTQHWEKLGVAALGIMRAFMAHCPVSDATLEARQQVAECAFHSWRKLPNGFQHDYEQAMIALWQAVPAIPAGRLGGRGFQVLAKLMGRGAAGRLLRYLQRPRYAAIATLNRRELDQLVTGILTLSEATA